MGSFISNTMARVCRSGRGGSTSKIEAERKLDILQKRIAECDREIRLKETTLSRAEAEWQRLAAEGEEVIRADSRKRQAALQLARTIQDTRTLLDGFRNARAIAAASVAEAKRVLRPDDPSNVTVRSLTSEALALEKLIQTTTNAGGAAAEVELSKDDIVALDERNKARKQHMKQEAELAAQLLSITEDEHALIGETARARGDADDAMLQRMFAEMPAATSRARAPPAVATTGSVPLVKNVSEFL